MSSSLDDLEPYEQFQHELDDYLKAYESHLKNSKTEFSQKSFLVIHQFIEYTCFIQSKSSFEELVSEEIKVDFLKFLYEELGNEINSLQVVSALREYFLYIDQHHKKLDADLLNWFKI